MGGCTTKSFCHEVDGHADGFVDGRQTTLNEAPEFQITLKYHREQKNYQAVVIILIFYQ